MPSPVFRRVIWALAAAAIGLALLVAFIPLFASTQIVRDRIALEMSAWSGYRVELGSGPTIEVFPTFRAILNNVSLSAWSDSERRPVVEAERVEIELSALSALAGNIVFSDVRLIRPTLRVGDSGKAAYLPTLPGGGRIARSIEVARAVVTADPANPDLGRLPAETFGNVQFSDGRIVLSHAGGDTEVVTSLSGSASWAMVNRAGRLSATGIWRGESMTVDLSSPNPLLLFGGGTAPVAFSFKSNPVNATFEGTANTSNESFIDGQLTFNSPSLRRLLEWSKTPISPRAVVGSVSINGHVTGNTRRAKFENAEIAMDENRGTGVLDVSIGDTVPGISGTLAFESLDLRSFLSALTPVGDASDTVSAEIDTRFTDRIMLDLRLSAARAMVGSLTMNEVAATAQVKSGLAVFDISDATAFGGTLQAGMRLERKSDGNQGEVRFLASDIDGAMLGSATGFAGLVPAARGKISATLKGPAKSWLQLLENAEGSISANFGPGNFAAVDLPAFLKRASQGGFFALSEIPNGVLPLKSAELQAALHNGIARIEKAEAISDARTISLSGIVPYVGGGLALSGRVYPANVDPAHAQAEATFFVGGAWSAPFISPILPSLPPE
jgi:AsmA protein